MNSEFRAGQVSAAEKDIQKPLISTQIIVITITNTNPGAIRSLINNTFHAQSGLEWEKLATGIHQASIKSKLHKTPFYALHPTRKPHAYNITSIHPTHKSIDELIAVGKSFTPEDCIAGLWIHLNRKILTQGSYEAVHATLARYRNMMREHLMRTKGLSFQDQIIPVPLDKLKQKQAEIPHILREVANDAERSIALALNKLLK